MSPPDEYLTTEQVASALKLRPGALARWRHTNQGPPWVRLGERAIRYPMTGLREWIAEQDGSAA